jgi:DNA-binding response OmpR family regulator
MTLSPTIPSLRKSILLVDDSEPMRALIYHTLSPKYRVTLAVDGADGYTKANENPRPDLIIANIVTPRADLLDMAARIRENDALGCVPIVFLTGPTSTTLMEGRLNGPSITYLPSSFHPFVLEKKVENMMRPSPMARATHVLG